MVESWPCGRRRLGAAWWDQHRTELPVRFATMALELLGRWGRADQTTLLPLIIRLLYLVFVSPPPPQFYEL